MGRVRGGLERDADGRARFLFHLARYSLNN